MAPRRKPESELFSEFLTSLGGMRHVEDGVLLGPFTLPPPDCVLNSKPAPSQIRSTKASVSCDHDHCEPPPLEPIGRAQKLTDSSSKGPQDPRASSVAKTATAPSSARTRAEKILALLAAQTREDFQGSTVAPKLSKDDIALMKRIGDAAARQGAAAPAESAPSGECPCDCQHPQCHATLRLVSTFRNNYMIMSEALLKSNEERRKMALRAEAQAGILASMKVALTSSLGTKDTQFKRHLLAIVADFMDQDNEVGGALLEELLDLRETAKDALDWKRKYDEQEDKHSGMKDCHDLTHEKYDDLEAKYRTLKDECKNLRETARVAASLRNQNEQLQKKAQKAAAEAEDAHAKARQLKEDFGKINSLKHEINQLKKKLATQSKPRESALTTVSVLDVKPAISEINVSNTGKKKGKKNSTPVSPMDVSVDQRSDRPSTSISTSAYQDRGTSTEPAIKEPSAPTKELGYLRSRLAEIESALIESENLRAETERQLLAEVDTTNEWQSAALQHSRKVADLQQELKIVLARISSLEAVNVGLRQRLQDAEQSAHAHAQACSQAQAQLQSQAHAQAQAQAQTNDTALDVESVRLLRQVKAKCRQLLEDIDRLQDRPGGLARLVADTQSVVQKVVMEIETDVKDLLDAKRGKMEYGTAPEVVGSQARTWDSTPLRHPSASTTTSRSSRPLTPASSVGGVDWSIWMK